MAVNTDYVSLEQYFKSWSDGSSGCKQIASTVECLAAAATALAKIIAQTSVTSKPDDTVTKNSDGDTQAQLDILAHDLFENALGAAPVGLMVSEECAEAIVLDHSAALAVVLDPLEGSSNIETNIPPGSIFSIYAFEPADFPLSVDSLMNRQGTDQVASGFFIFGPQTSLVLTVRDGTYIFLLDPESSEYRVSHDDVRVPQSQPEFAINASNYRHWDDSIRGYVDDCIAGNSGPREEEFNMRWIASLVAEAYRIFVRGGIFLSPRDQRPGYENGRLRLLYEAFPVALLIEQAGGAATDGENRILEQLITDLHARVPLVFGSKEQVERVARYYATPPVDKNRYALFEPRQLLRN
jgi:fructose-1,6-bisphosphatase I